MACWLKGSQPAIRGPIERREERVVQAEHKGGNRVGKECHWVCAEKDLIEYVGTAESTADILTKALKGIQTTRLSRMMSAVARLEPEIYCKSRLESVEVFV